MIISRLLLSAVAVHFGVSPCTAADTGGRAIHWYEAAAVVGATALAATVDPPVERFFQRHRSGTTDDLASAFRQMGQPVSGVGVPVGLTLVGLASGDDGVRDAGLRSGASIVVAGIAAEGLKISLGRGRPNAGVGAYDFRPFTTGHDSLGVESRNSFPSGHSVVAFALAASLADDIHRTPVTVALYTAATGTALSRLNDDRHWLSDVVFGAALGISSAKLVSGRWRVFGLRPPAFLVVPGGSAVAWHRTF